MAVDIPADLDFFDQPMDAPLVLVGQPSLLHGELRLRNPTDDKLILRDVRVYSDLLARSGDEGGPDHHALRRLILRPGDAKRVPLQLQLRPHTPPGEYHGVVEANGHR